jgi:hypothetical protein
MAREVRRDDVADPRAREGHQSRSGVAGHQAPAPRPRSVRCRRETDGALVWVPVDQVDGFPGEVVDG